MRAFVVSSVLLGGVVASSVACGPEAPPTTTTARIGQPIISGTVDTAAANNAVVMLESNQGRCTGTIFQKSASATWILTAAHCVPTETVVVGPNGQTSNTIYDVASYEADERYGDGNSQFSQFYDVALVKVSGSIPNVTPIELAGSSDGLSNNAAVVSYGYGSTVGYNQGQNQQRHSLARNIAGLSPNLITYDQSDGKGICSGDSGGPVTFVDANQNRRVVGVHSTVANQPGEEQCFGQANSIRVSARRDFIDAVLANTTRPGLSACQSCLENSDDSSTCSQKRQRCQSDDACSDLSRCLRQGGGAGCLDDYPQGVGPYLDVLECGCSDTCAAQCATDELCQDSAKCGVAFTGLTYTACVNEHCCAEADAAAADGVGYICLGDPNSAGCDSSTTYQAFAACAEEHCGGKKPSSSSSSGEASSSSSSGAGEEEETTDEEEASDEEETGDDDTSASTKSSKDEGGCAVSAAGHAADSAPSGALFLIAAGMVVRARRRSARRP